MCACKKRKQTPKGICFVKLSVFFLFFFGGKSKPLNPFAEPAALEIINDEQYGSKRPSDGIADNYGLDTVPIGNCYGDPDNPQHTDSDAGNQHGY